MNNISTNDKVYIIGSTHESGRIFYMIDTHDRDTKYLFRMCYSIEEVLKDKDTLILKTLDEAKRVRGEVIEKTVYPICIRLWDKSITREGDIQ